VLQVFIIAASTDSDALELPVNQQRPTTIEGQYQLHLTSARYGVILSRSERWQMFPALTHVFSFWIKVQTPELVLYNKMIQKFVSLSFIL